MGRPDLQLFTDLVPLALGLAVSPLPVAAVVVLLLSVRARAVGGGFTLGFVGGILAAVFGGVLLSATLFTTSSDQGGSGYGWLRIGLGVVLLGLGLHRLVRRLRAGRDARPPRWLAALDRLTFGRAVALGLLLSAGNPKNLPIALAAGLTIATSARAPALSASAAFLFVLVGASTVLVPVLVHRVAPSMVDAPFRWLRRGLARRGPVAVIVVLLVVGGLLLAQGLVRL